MTLISGCGIGGERKMIFFLKTIVAENGDIDLINVYDVCAKPAIGVGESLDVKHVANLMTDSVVKRVLAPYDNRLLGLVP